MLIDVEMIIIIITSDAADWAQDIIITARTVSRLTWWCQPIVFKLSKVLKLSNLGKCWRQTLEYLNFQIEKLFISKLSEPVSLNAKKSKNTKFS